MNTREFIFNKYNLKEEPIIKLNCTRWGTLPKLFRQLGYTVGAEVGVYKGRFSKALLEGNPELRLYGIDIWEPYEGYEDTVNKHEFEELYKETRTRLKPFLNWHPIIDWSMKAVKRFDDETLDFVYIDSNHSYESAKEDIREWSKKVKKGGIIAGHDYINGHNGITFGVIRAVNEWVKKKKISPLFVLNKNSNTDQMPSWFYIND